jgi:hypothetical protein
MSRRGRLVRLAGVGGLGDIEHIHRERQPLPTGIATAALLPLGLAARPVCSSTRSTGRNWRFGGATSPRTETSASDPPKLDTRSGT